MPIRAVIRFSILALTTVSAFFLIRGVLYATPSFLAEISKTKFGYNPQIVTNLSEQRGDAVTGFILLILSFVLQSIDGILPVRWKDFESNSFLFLLGLIIAIIILLVTGIAFSKKIAGVTEQKVMEMLKKMPIRIST